jgi:hypothetical protein
LYLNSFQKSKTNTNLKSLNTRQNCNQSNKAKDIIIFHQNIQHLKSRVEPLHIVLEELDVDIVVLSEHMV